MAEYPLSPDKKPPDDAEFKYFLVMPGSVYYTRVFPQPENSPAMEYQGNISFHHRKKFPRIKFDQEICCSHYVK